MEKIKFTSKTTNQKGKSLSLHELVQDYEKSYIWFKFAFKVHSVKKGFDNKNKMIILIK